MNAKNRLGILFLTWLVTLSSLPVIAQSGTFLTPMKTDGYRLTSSPFTLRVPVSVSQNIDIESFRIEVIDVSLEKERNDDFLAAFSAPAIKKKEGNGIAFIETEIDPTKLKRQGNYGLYFAVSSRTGQQFIKIDIDRPAAKLYPIPPIKILQTNNWLDRFSFFSGQPLTLEVAGKSAIENLAIVQQEVANSSGSISSSQIEVDPVKGPLSLGEPKQLAYRLNGRFPIGKNSGKIRISSPQLATPVEIDFEVLSRRSYLLIPILLFFGFAVGFLTKHTFKNWKLKQEAKSSVLELGRKIAEFQKNKDIAFRTNVESKLNELRKLLNEKDAKTLVDRVKIISESFQKSLNDLEARKKTAAADHRFLSKILESRPLMPPNLKDPFDTFTERFSDAESFLKIEDFSTGQDKLDLSRVELAANIKMPIEKWHGWQQRVLDELKTDPRAFSSSLARQLDDGIEQVNEKLDPALFLQSLEEPTAEQLWSGLQTVHQGHFAVLGFLRYTVSRIIDVREDVIGTLRDSGAALNEKEINALNRNIERLLEAFGPDKEIGKDAAKEISKAKRGLFSAWKNAINVRDKSDWSADDKDDLIAALKTGEYVRAAQIVAENHSKTIKLNEAIPKVMGAIDSPRLTTPESNKMYNADSVIIKTESTLDLVTDDAMPHAEFFSAEQAKLESQGLYTGLLQFTVIALGLGFVGYFLMVDNFIGTGKELLFIFLWGFGLDLSVDDLLKKAAGFGR